MQLVRQPRLNVGCAGKKAGAQWLKCVGVSLLTLRSGQVLMPYPFIPLYTSPKAARISSVAGCPMLPMWVWCRVRSGV